MISIPDNSFAEWCLENKTTSELDAMLVAGPSPDDLQAWSMTERQWRRHLELAREAKGQ